MGPPRPGGSSGACDPEGHELDVSHASPAAPLHKVGTTSPTDPIGRLEASIEQAARFVLVDAMVGLVEGWARALSEKAASAVHHPLGALGVALALRPELCLLDLGEVVRREREVGSCRVLLEPVALGGPRDGNDPGFLG